MCDCVKLKGTSTNSLSGEEKKLLLNQNWQKESDRTAHVM